MKRHHTIEDVASKASVSISTVSLVLNEKPYVSDATRRKVKQVIRELGYHPHRSARDLASKSSGNIGFILTDDHFQLTEPFYTRIFLGTEFAARKLNYYVLLTSVSRKFSNPSSIPRFLLERNVDGVIIAGKIDEEYVTRISAMGIPIVLVDYTLPRGRVSSVLIDNRQGAAAAVAHLIREYHRSIAFIGGDIEHPSIAERFEGYREALHASNIPLDNELIDTAEEETGISNGYLAMRRMLTRGAKPRAVFAANDAMALGCVRYLKEMGIRIPHDIAIAGFDDIEMSSHVEPRLTTVRVFKEKMGKLSLECLVQLIKSKSDNVVTIHVPVELVVRESSNAHKTSYDDVLNSMMD